MTYVELHGGLSVKNGRLTGQNGEAVRLCGMSTHGIAWRGSYINEDTFLTLRDGWQTNCIRLALYTAEFRGYCTGGDKQELMGLVKKGVDLAVKLGMYVIVDWHVLGEKSPLVYADEAERFFDELSRSYAGVPNLLYELCNEPNGPVDWAEIKGYAERIIPVIRKNSPGAVVIVGSPEWSQRVDMVLEAPLECENVLYSMHFYAATHKDSLRERVRCCLAAGLPILISECNITEASGDGEPDEVSGGLWFEMLEEYKVGFICWSLASNRESSGVIADGCTKLSDWEDSEIKHSGLWFRERFRSCTDK